MLGLGLLVGPTVDDEDLIPACLPDDRRLTDVFITDRKHTARHRSASSVLEGCSVRKPNVAPTSGRRKAQVG